MSNWKGSAQLADSLVAIGELTRHPQNPRRGDVPAIAESLKRFGQTRPVLVDQNGVVVAGNHTLLAAESLGWTHIGVTVNEFASEAEARAYLLADNRLADLGEYDRSELVALVAELEDSGQWDGTGYNADDLDHLRALEEAASGEGFNNAVTPEELAARAASVAGDQSLNAVVLLLEDDASASLVENVRKLSARYGTTGDQAVTLTILRAVRDEALLAHTGAS